MVKTSDNFRVCVALFGAALLAVMLSGCCSVSVSHKIDSDVSLGLIGGRYKLDGVDASLSAALKKHAPSTVVFTDEDDPSAVPLKISFLSVGDEKDKTSALHVLPGCFTFLLLPAFCETHRGYSVRVESPMGCCDVSFTQIQRDATSSLPIGLLPYAYPLDGYDYGIELDHNYLDGETRMNAASEGLTNAVAKVVISTLTRARYDAYMKELADGRLRKQQEDEAKRREAVLRSAESGWPQESTLRDFAVKETAGLWDIVVSFRAEISIRKSRLRKLSEAIKGFGRKPEEDADFISCKGEYDAARSALAQIFKSLECTYLAANKNDALYDSVEARERTRKAVEECSCVAIEAANRILNHK